MGSIARGCSRVWKPLFNGICCGHEEEIIRIVSPYLDPVFE